MRGVVALAHVTVGTPFSFVRVAFNAYTTHSIAQFHASGWLRQRCPAKRQSFPALPSDKIVYASFYPGDFPSTDGSINNHQKINADGTTILLVEQNSNAALSVAHRGYVMETGHIIMSDTAENLRKNEAVRKAYLGIE